MSILGKIVTVLMLIASLAVGAMVVAMAKSGNDWYGPYQEADAKRTKAVEAVSVLRVAVADRNAEYAKMRQLLSEKIETQRQTIDGLNGKAADLESKRREQETLLNTLQAKISGLDASLAALIQEKKDLESKHLGTISDATQVRQANQKLRVDNQNLVRENEDLRARVRDLEVQVADLTKKVLWYREKSQVTELPQTAPPPSVSLAGVINNVDNARKVAEISLGSRDKVVEKMTFFVSRGEQYLADLVIEKVDENTAFGRLETVQGEIRKGDNVTYTVKR